jgi:hypothetical protein
MILSRISIVRRKLVGFATMFALVGVMPLAFATSDSSLSDTLDVSRPAFENLTGTRLDTVEPGIQVMIMHSIRNNVYPDEKSLVSLLEVRNKDGVTEYIAWQSASIQSNNTATFGVSWLVPSEATSGDIYSARVFAVTTLGDGAEVLSAVFQSEIAIS